MQFSAQPIVFPFEQTSMSGKTLSADALVCGGTGACVIERFFEVRAMRNVRPWLAALVAGVLMCGMIGGCSSSTPSASEGNPTARGTEGGRQIDDSQAGGSRFDADGFMGGFEGSPTP
jgi:hypothetical protein